MKTKIAALVMAALAIGGCGKSPVAIQPPAPTVPNPFPAGLAPGMDAFQVEAAIKSNQAPRQIQCGIASSTEKFYYPLVIAGETCALTVFFHEQALTRVSIKFNFDGIDGARIVNLLMEKYGVPSRASDGAYMWSIKSQPPALIGFTSGRGVTRVTYYDQGPHGQAELAAMKRTTADVAKKSGL